MDLKSILSESSAQRPPRLHTPQSSYESRETDRTPIHESQPNRSATFPPPLQPVDSRSYSGGGGYFGFGSPHQTNLPSASTHASTPSAHSVHARSPGPHPQVYTPRDGAGPQNLYNTPFVPSPSASAHQPPTPGSAHQYQSHTPISSHSHVGPHSHFVQSQSPRASYPPNGQVNQQSRQISPNAQYHQKSATPLGPPINYTRVSPSAQRPTSQGYDHHHYRKGSYGSAGSAQSREYPYSASGQPQPDPSRIESVQRQSSAPGLERLNSRDKSLSVSPKTIPKPSPYRQTSSSSVPGSATGSRPPSAQLAPEPRQESIPPTIAENKTEMQATPNSVGSLGSNDQSARPRGPAMGPTQTPAAVQQQMIAATSSPVSTHRSSPVIHQTPSLKRNASLISGTQSPLQPPTKRLRRDDIPIWARSSRSKPVKFGDGSKKAQPQTLAPRQHMQHSQPQANNKPPAVTNGHAGLPMEPVGGLDLDKHTWEPTISNEPPPDDLSQAICHWIYEEIGKAPPRSGEAMFEVEAKLGEIRDIETQSRIVLPVSSEALFKKDLYKGRTKFQSSMNMEQHRKLNEYLNMLTQRAASRPEKDKKEGIRFQHLREFDDFYELNPEGLQNLDPAIRQYVNPRQMPRVRRTVDKATGSIKATIIKTRIADIEVYNPRCAFDYRISISVESPWNGDLRHLQPMREGEGSTRLKDRMSYRHLTNQVDLTQVSHEDSQRQEHELEVEMSSLQLHVELEKLKAHRNNWYERMVCSLVDNTRLLCRQGTQESYQTR